MVQLRSGGNCEPRKVIEILRRLHGAEDSIGSPHDVQLKAQELLTSATASKRRASEDRLKMRVELLAIGCSIACVEQRDLVHGVVKSPSHRPLHRPQATGQLRGTRYNAILKRYHSRNESTPHPQFSSRVTRLIFPPYPGAQLRPLLRATGRYPQAPE